MWWLSFQFPCTHLQSLKHIYPTPHSSRISARYCIIPAVNCAGENCSDLGLNKPDSILRIVSIRQPLSYCQHGRWFYHWLAAVRSWKVVLPTIVYCGISCLLHVYQLDEIAFLPPAKLLPDRWADCTRFPTYSIAFAPLIVCDSA